MWDETPEVAAVREALGIFSRELLIVTPATGSHGVRGAGDTVYDGLLLVFEHVTVFDPTPKHTLTNPSGRESYDASTEPHHGPHRLTPHSGSRGAAPMRAPPSSTPPMSNQTGASNSNRGGRAAFEQSDNALTSPMTSRGAPTPKALSGPRASSQGSGYQSYSATSDGATGAGSAGVRSSLCRWYADASTVAKLNTSTAGIDIFVGAACSFQLTDIGNKEAVFNALQYVFGPEGTRSASASRAAGEARPSKAQLGAVIYPDATKRLRHILATLNDNDHLFSDDGSPDDHSPNPAVAFSPPRGGPGSPPGVRFALPPTGDDGGDDEAEFVMASIDGAIVTNHRLFFATSVVELSAIEFIVKRDGALELSLGRSLRLRLQCLEFQQEVLVRKWLISLLDALDVEHRPELVTMLALHRQFCAIDGDRDGFISLEEFKQVMTPVFPIPDVEENFFRIMDADHSGELSFAEFAVGMTDLLTAGPSARMRFIFSLFDADSDGSISEEELTAVLVMLQRSGDVVATDTSELHALRDRLFSICDTDGDGVITAEEFSDALSVPEVQSLLCRLGFGTEHEASPVRGAAALTKTVSGGGTGGNSGGVVSGGSGGGAAAERASASSVVVTPADPSWPVLGPAMNALRIVVDQLRSAPRVTPSVIRVSGRGKGDEAIEIHQLTAARELMAKAGVDPAALEHSLGLDNVTAHLLLGSPRLPRYHATPQRDGLSVRDALLELSSSDGMFRVFAVTPTALDLYIDMLPAYTAHVAQYPNHFLPLFLCAVSCYLPGGGAHHFIVTKHRGFQNPAPVSLWDLPRMQMPQLYLDRGWHSLVAAQLRLDIDFAFKHARSAGIEISATATLQQLAYLPPISATAAAAEAAAAVSALTTTRSSGFLSGGGGGCCGEGAVATRDSSIATQLASGKAAREAAKRQRADQLLAFSSANVAADDSNADATTDAEDSDAGPILTLNQRRGRRVLFTNHGTGLGHAAGGAGDRSVSETAEAGVQSLETIAASPGLSNTALHDITAAGHPVRILLCLVFDTDVLGQGFGGYGGGSSSCLDSFNGALSSTRIGSALRPPSSSAFEKASAAAHPDAVLRRVTESEIVAVAKSALAPRETNILPTPSAGPQCETHAVVTGTGREGTLTLDKRARILYLTCGGRTVFSVSLRVSFGLSFVRPKFLTQQNKTHLVIRGEPTPDFKKFNVHSSLKFPSPHAVEEMTGSIFRSEGRASVAGMQRSPFKVHCVHWNVGSTVPPLFAASELLKNSAGADIIVVSASKCVFQAPGRPVTQSCEADWHARVMAELPGYFTIQVASIGALRVVVAGSQGDSGRPSVGPFISGVDVWRASVTDAAAVCGLGLCVSLQLHQSRFAFVCVEVPHVRSDFTNASSGNGGGGRDSSRGASVDDASSMRSDGSAKSGHRGASRGPALAPGPQRFHTVMSRLSEASGLPVDIIAAHHHSFVQGDFGFGTTAGMEDAVRLASFGRLLAGGSHGHSAANEAAASKLLLLQKRDVATKHRRRNGVLHRAQEPVLTFPPTSWYIRDPQQVEQATKAVGASGPLSANTLSGASMRSNVYALASEAAHHAAPATPAVPPSPKAQTPEAGRLSAAGATPPQVPLKPRLADAAAAASATARAMKEQNAAVAGGVTSGDLRALMLQRAGGSGAAGVGPCGADGAPLPPRIFDENTGRVPSWLSRVFYYGHGHPMDTCERSGYGSIDTVRTSPHDAIHTTFDVSVRQQYVMKRQLHAPAKTHTVSITGLRCEDVPVTAASILGFPGGVGPRLASGRGSPRRKRSPSRSPIPYDTLDPALGSLHLSATGGDDDASETSQSHGGGVLGQSMSQRFAAQNALVRQTSGAAHSPGMMATALPIEPMIVFSSPLLADPAAAKTSVLRGGAAANTLTFGKDTSISFGHQSETCGAGVATTTFWWPEAHELQLEQVELSLLAASLLTFSLVDVDARGATVHLAQAVVPLNTATATGGAVGQARDRHSLSEHQSSVSKHTSVARAGPSSSPPPRTPYGVPSQNHPTGRSGTRLGEAGADGDASMSTLDNAPADAKDSRLVKDVSVPLMRHGRRIGTLHATIAVATE